LDITEILNSQNPEAEQIKFVLQILKRAARDFDRKEAALASKATDLDRNSALIEAKAAEVYRREIRLEKSRSVPSTPARSSAHGKRFTRKTVVDQKKTIVLFLKITRRFR
jgi:hypothetical protein